MLVLDDGELAEFTEDLYYVVEQNGDAYLIDEEELYDFESLDEWEMNLN